MKISFMKPDISSAEIDAVVKVLKSGWITTGPTTKEFESELANYIGCNKVATFSSQTMAAEMCLQLLGIGPGDEVIVPAYTYSASCSIVYHVGATPVIVDCSSDSYEMNYDVMEECINEKTKAIIPVDLAGVIVDYERIFQAVYNRKHLFTSRSEIQDVLGRVAVIGDTAHSLGALSNGVRAGHIADFSNFSFHAVKNLTTGEGGATSWRTLPGITDDEIYRRFMLLSLHGQSKDALAKNRLGDWEYDIVEPLYKCNLTDVAAAIGLSQLKRYENMLARRKSIVDFYNNQFNNLGVSWLEHDGKEFSSSRHLYMLRLAGHDEKQRNDFIVRMAEKGVACNVHYKPLPMLSAYAKRGFKIDDYPEAFRMYSNEVTLPLYSTLTDSEVEFIVKCVKEELGK